ncbi:hypothetical protein ETH_00022720 [Eimeria tenella]|uniref:Uncharacterized protein n=1 Tax=Eimeria tenella TaxID=5802 RepID=U6KZ43_EIMTE|nr:hypothetical protein ETH_00022720 [Eimeria tenella]CDJ41594.1 hypothetical protein ETH_00022720 [Eimeria tenella]|eukprot:XP_013232344.1 hypothetical protein ETH_00022720 [Eimeria tenella]
MLDSPTSQGLLQQLQISLSLLMEDAASLPRALANRLSLYGTALHTLHKILGSGHCSSCPEGRKPCSFCRAVMFRDFVHVTIQGLGLSSDTMPDSLSWAEFRGQDFLLFAETASGPALLGVELDFHTDMLTRPSPRRKHLPQLATYAATCLNAHITSMVVKQKSSRSHCYGLNNYMKSLVQTLPMDKFAPLMNANVFRDAVIEGCNVRVEDAVTSCLEGDGELLALQRLPEFKVDGHSAIYDYVRSLLSPGTAPAILFPWPNAFLVMGDSQTPQLDQTQLFMHALAAVTAAPLASIDFSTIDLSSKPHVLSAAPTLSEFLSLLAKEAGSSGTRPLVDYLFRDEGSSQTSVISSGIDDAVAAKGHTPSAGSTFYVRLWSHPAKGLSILEGILANSETSQEGSSGQSDTSERSEDSDSEAVQQVQEYSRRLQRQQPDKHLLITRTLSWPENKDPENFNEARQFVDVASVPERHVAEDVVPFLKRLSYSTPDAYGQVCQRLGWTTPRLPNTPEEAEAFVAALRDVRALQGPVRRWLADLGESVSTSTTWSQVKAIIDKAHGE